MKRRNEKRNGPVEVGCVVRVAVSDVDRGRLDNPTVTAVVVEAREHPTGRKYRLATRAGLLKTTYWAGDVWPLPLATPRLHGLAEVLEHWRTVQDTTPLRDCAGISVRASVAAISVTGGQGMIRCDCTGACNTLRCACFKANRLCTSRCHKGRSCLNRCSDMCSGQRLTFMAEAV